MGCHFPPPGDPPTPGIELVSPALAGRLGTTEPPGIRRVGLGWGKRGAVIQWALSFSYGRRISSRDLYNTVHIVNNTVLCSSRFKRLDLKVNVHTTNKSGGGCTRKL